MIGRTTVNTVRQISINALSLLIVAALLHGISGCDPWPWTNPLDPDRCSSPCSGELICYEGECVKPSDGGAPDGGSADLSDGPAPLSDSLVDAMPPDAKTDLVSVDLFSGDTLEMDTSSDLIPADTSVDSIPDDATVDSVPDDATVDSVPTDATVDSVPDDATVDSVPPSTPWSFEPTNPILKKTGTTFEQAGVGSPVVIKDGSVYKMWYVGSTTNDVGAIGYATSTDGILWTRPSASPVLTVGSNGDIDEKGISPTTVILDEGTYKMWYLGEDVFGGFNAAYATSPDGIVWTKYGNGVIVLFHGAPGDWDETAAVFQGVTKDVSGYSATYLGGNSVGTLGFGWATSTDGISWVKAPNNPVHLFPSNLVSVGRGTLFKVGSTYHHYYPINRALPSQTGVYSATSTDGIVWVEDAGNPVVPLVDFSPWEPTVLKSISVLQDGPTTLKMWFGGKDPLSTNSAIGLATHP